MKPGKLIVFEGINGCGKGMQIIKFADYFLKLNRANTIFLTREPNEFDDNGRKAREMLASDGNPYKNKLKAVKYMALNRVAHNNVFGPMLKQGIDVISDRYYDSSFAFQHAQGVPSKEIARANRRFIRVPDLTILLDVPVEVAFERLSSRIDSRRKFDSHRDFMEKVRQNYLELPDILPKLMRDNNILIINGDKSPDKVFEDIKFEYHNKFMDKLKL